MTGLEYGICLLVGRLLAELFVETTPEITGVRICPQHDVECKKDWPKHEDTTTP